MRSSFPRLAGLSLLLFGAGCSNVNMMSPFGGRPPPPPTVQQSSQFAVPTLLINAPIKQVRQVIIERAKSRGTTVASVIPEGVTLERELTVTPTALESICGPHRPGRRIRVLLGTAEQATGTLVSEQRMIVDGANECPIPQTPDVVASANQSLNELKTQVETAVARR